MFGTVNLFGNFIRPAEARWFESSAGRAGRFDAVASWEGRTVPVRGTRVAREGLALVSNVALRAEFDVTFTLRSRTIPSRVRIVKDEPLREASHVIHRYFCAFVALAHDDRAAVIRYVDNIPELDAAATHFVDGRPLLPESVQAEIQDWLVKLGRLAPPTPGLAPLIRLEAGPAFPVDDSGRTMRIVMVHSRLREKFGLRSFTTRFRVFSDDHLDFVK